MQAAVGWGPRHSGRMPGGQGPAARGDRRRRDAAYAAAMSASSHQAELSSVRSQLEEMRARVEKIALTYQGTPDSAVAADLFEADRALTTAGRTIDRALTALSELAASQ